MKIILKDVVLMQKRTIETEKGAFVSLRLNVAPEYGEETSTELTLSADPSTEGLSSLSRIMETVEIEATGYVGKGFAQKITAKKITVKGGVAK